MKVSELLTSRNFFEREQVLRNSGSVLKNDFAVVVVEVADELLSHRTLAKISIGSKISMSRK